MLQGFAPKCAVVSRPYELGMSAQVMAAMAAGSVSLTQHSELSPGPVYSCAVSGRGNDSEAPRKATYVDNILDMLLTREAGGLRRQVQHLRAQAYDSRREDGDAGGGSGGSHAGGMLAGMRQSSGSSAGLLLLPVLDLGKPPTALAF